MECRKCEILEEKVDRESDEILSLEEAIVMLSRCLGAELARNRVLQEENDSLRLENAGEDFSPQRHREHRAEKETKEIVPAPKKKPGKETVPFGKPASGPVVEARKKVPVLKGKDMAGIDSDLIVKTVCEFFNVSNKQFYGKIKTGNVGDARKTATYLVKKMLRMDGQPAATALQCAIGTIFRRTCEFNKNLKDPEIVKRVEIIEGEIIKKRKVVENG